MRRIFLLLLLVTSSVFAQDNFVGVTALRNDVDYLEATFKHLHPGLYRYNSEKEVNELFADLRYKATKPVKLSDWYIALSEFCSKIRCGHTFLSPFNQEDSIMLLIAPKKVLPIYFKVLDNKFVVTYDFSGANINTGDAIIEVNGIASEKIINKLLDVTRADGNNAKEKRLSELEVSNTKDGVRSVFDIYYPLFFGIDDRINVTVERLNGGKEQLAIETISPSFRKELYDKKFGEVPVDAKSWKFEIIDKKTAHLSLGTFAFFNDDFKWKNYIDSVFAIVKKQKVENLILDIRNNEGGNNGIRDYILSYITPKKITGEFQARRCVKNLSIPDSLKKNLSTWDKSFFQPKDSNDFFVNELGLYEKKNKKTVDSIDVRSDRFKDNVYLLTNAENSSATFDMAWTFQENKLGKIVGEKTGGTKQGLNGGQMFFFKLPGSQLEIDLPLIYYYRNAPDEGVQPDYPVSTIRKDIAIGKDTQLEFTLRLINSK